MPRQRHYLAVVGAESGRPVGLVASADLVEEIVGGIAGAFAPEVAPVKNLGAGHDLLNARRASQALNAASTCNCPQVIAQPWPVFSSPGWAIRPGQGACHFHHLKFPTR